MFTYLDPSVRQRLVDAGKLRRIDAQGQALDVNADPVPGQLSINLLGPISLPVRLGAVEETFQWYAAVRNTELSKVEALAESLRREGGQNLFSQMASSMAVNSVLVYGDLASAKAPLVRVHSSCLTGDVFGSQRCECGPQFIAALERISQDDVGGMLIYMSGHEGRGIV